MYIYSLTRGGYTQVASGQSTYAVSVSNLRGTIYDRNMLPLVNNNKEYRAAVVPDESLLPLLRPAMTAANYRLLTDKFTTRKPTVVTLEKPVAFAEGIQQFFVPSRYGQRLLAPHLIGYMDGGKQKGITGLEAAYDSLLEEYSGEAQVSFAVDGIGNCLQGVKPVINDNTDRAKGGIVLTLDKEIQQIVEDTASEYLDNGAVIVMDPMDGAILAMASLPSFQPDTVASSLLNEDGALLNRALSLYDCGSVFKMITASAALESGISAQQVYTCNGGLDVERTLFHCHDRLGHQQLNMDSAMAFSCNLYFIQLADQIGASALYQMMDNFGLTSSIELAENIHASACVMPSLAELQQVPAALGNISIGQGKLLASPLHIARMTAAIANNGLMPSPYLIKGTVNETENFTATPNGRGEPVVTASTAKTIQNMLKKVVTDGTGQQAQPSACTSAGKTGTAETGQIKDGSPVVQSWFTGYIPAESPKYIITVLAENAKSTNASASQLFCEISNKLID